MFLKTFMCTTQGLVLLYVSLDVTVCKAFVEHQFRVQIAFAIASVQSDFSSF